MTDATDDNPQFDLQSHSVHSDGGLDPTQVVELAHAAGVRLLALSDHDTVAGVQEALDAGRRLGMTVVPAAELSAIDGEHEDLHILGYRIDHRQPELLAALGRFRADRETRAHRMADALVQSGLELDDQLLAERRREGASIGRPHLARAVFDHPANVPRLRAEGLESFEAVLKAYLLPGRAAYRGRTTPTVLEAIEVIHAAGGVAVWAHPFWDLEDPAAVIATLERFAENGIDGVESFYVTHDREQTQVLDDAARRLGLLSTGSSDFHAPSHSLFSRFRAFSLHGREPRLGPIAE